MQEKFYRSATQYHTYKLTILGCTLNMFFKEVPCRTHVAGEKNGPYSCCRNGSDGLEAAAVSLSVCDNKGSYG